MIFTLDDNNINSKTKLYAMNSIPKSFSSYIEPIQKYKLNIHNIIYKYIYIIKVLYAQNINQ